MTHHLPTTNIFFLDACGESVARWWRRGPIRRLGANTFQCGDTLLLIRRDSEALMRRALGWPHRLVYLIDDDIAGAAASAGLPQDYRRRLAAFHHDYHAPLIARADHLLVTSPSLAALLAGDRPVTMIDPFWSLPPADQAHFRGAGVTGPVRLAHLGSGSHGGALALLESAMLRLLDSGRNVTFTFVARQGEHPALDLHPSARRIDPKGWPRYRRWIARQRFHIGLYPLLDTPFDHARSANKIVEHGIVGAVGVYPEGWPAARCLEGGAVLAPDNVAAWHDVLTRMVDDPKQLEQKACSAASQLPALYSAAMQRAAWSTVFEAAL